MIRMLQIEQSKRNSLEVNILNPVNPMFQLSWSESHKNFDSCYLQILKFYNLHKEIKNHYERIANYKDGGDNMTEISEI